MRLATRVACRLCLCNSLALLRPGVRARSDLPPLVYHERYSIPGWPERHRFPMGKFGDLAAELVRAGDATRADFLTPSAPAPAQLALVHARAYTEQLVARALPPAAARKTGFAGEFDARLVERTLLEVGGTLLTARLALERGLACNLAGGTHHAHRAHGAGYCLINDLAVAAAAARAGALPPRPDAARASAIAPLARVAIVDLDVHQGDGTASIFADDPSVLTVSVHAASNYPFEKAASDLDVALPDGVGDDEYVAALERDVLPRVRAFAPQLVLYDAGVDVHARDALGRLGLTDAGLAARDERVIRWCVDERLPVACVIGGGYDRDRAALARRHASLHRAAIRVWRTTPRLSQPRGPAVPVVV